MLQRSHSPECILTQLDNGCENNENAILPSKYDCGVLPLLP